MKNVLLIISCWLLLLMPGYRALCNNKPQGVCLESLMDQTLAALYHFDFPRADSLSGCMLQIDPHHYLSHFTRSHYLWWMIITHQRDENLEKEYSATIAMAKARLPSAEKKPDINDVFYHINIYAMQARLSLQKKEYLRTIWNLRACVRQLDYSRGKENLHGGLYLTSGLYNYMSGYSQKRFPVLKAFSRVLPEGEMQMGLQQLQKAAASSNPVWKTEAHYLLMKIYLEMELQPGQAMVYNQWLIDNFPGNLTYWQYRYRICKAMKDEPGMESCRVKIRQLALGHAGISKLQRDFFLQFAEE